MFSADQLTEHEAQRFCKAFDDAVQFGGCVDDTGPRPAACVATGRRGRQAAYAGASAATIDDAALAALMGAAEALMKTNADAARNLFGLKQTPGTTDAAALAI